MKLVYIPAIISIFCLFNLPRLIKMNTFKNSIFGKLGLIIYVTTTLFLSSFLIDYLSFIGSQLPSKVGKISQVQVNKKIGVPSKIILDGHVYNVDTSLVRKRTFHPNRIYKISYTPINKVVLEVITLDI